MRKRSFAFYSIALRFGNRCSTVTIKPAPGGTALPRISESTW